MTDSTITFNPICRTCLEPATQKTYPLTGELVFNLDLDVASMLEFCTSSKLKLSDDLPDIVCLPCFRTIRIAYRFLKQFYEAQKKLLELTDKQKSNDETETILTDEESGNTEDFLSCHDYAEQSTNVKQVSENESVDTNYKSSNDETGTEKLLDIHKVAEKYGNGEIEFTKIQEESEIKMIVVSKNKNQHATLYSYICPICHEKFCRSNFFYSHVTSHELSKIKCTRCAVQPELELEEYFRHYMVYHRYQCYICDKSMSTNLGYNYHMNLHKNMKKLKCPIKGCRRKFISEVMLKSHIKLHSAKKIYNCDLCESTFKNKDNLNYHLKIHAGKRDHLCSICGRAFYQAVTLRDHIYRHTGYKKFVCDVCGKRFTTNGTLTKHIQNCSRKNNIL